MVIRAITLIGAGGNLGPTVLSALRCAAFPVTIITRAASKSNFPDGVAVVQVSDSYPESELVPAFQGQDAVVCTIAALIPSAQKQIIKAAVHAGVRRFLPAEFGLETRDADSLRLIPPMSEKVDILDQLIAYESDTFSWSAITTGVFFDWGLRSGFMHFDLSQRTALILNDGEALFSSSTLATIAEAVVRVLEREDMTKNKTLFIQSFTTSQNEILQELEKCTGQRWHKEKRDEKSFVEESQKKWKAGNPRGLYDIVLARGTLHSNYEKSPNFANGLLGLRELSVKEEIRKII